MPKSANQKLKLLYIKKMLMEKTDPDHQMTVNEIIAELGRYGIEAERKTIYADIEALRQYGLDILTQKSKSTGYFIASRSFDLVELKLLADAIAGPKFITEKKSKALIQKLGELASHSESRQLQRNVLVHNRVKTQNEHIYYNIDTINQAITQKRSLTFKYYEYDLQKKKVYRKDGGDYVITPYTLFWDDENYYVIAYYDRYQNICNFRVDRMENVEVIENPLGIPEEKFDIGTYARKTFSMFVGQEESVKLELHKSLVNVIFDKFGKEVYIRPVAGEYFQVTLSIAVSPAFCGWLFQFGTDAKILSPDYVAREYHERAKKLLQHHN